MSTKAKSNGAVTKELPPASNMQITLLEAGNLKYLLGGCSSKGLGVDSFISYIELFNVIDKAASERQVSIKVLMNAYGIEKPVQEGNQMVWPYKNHKDKKEIEDKLEAISGKMVTVSPVNFVPKEEFHAFTVNGLPLQMVDIAALAKVLLKK